MNPIPMMSKIAEDQSTGLPWWFWLILIVVIVAIFLWLWFSGKKSAPESLEAKKEMVVPAAEVEVRVKKVIEEPVIASTKIDDFNIIEGIGPKINQVLHTAGVNTFAQLAGSDFDTLKKILLEANLRLADPTTWPQQAALAGEGKMDELKALQDKLNAGRA